MKKLLAIVALLPVLLMAATESPAKDGLNIESWEPLQVVVTDNEIPNIVVINGSDNDIDPEFSIHYGSIERPQFGTLYAPRNDIRVQPFG